MAIRILEKCVDLFFFGLHLPILQNWKPPFKISGSATVDSVILYVVGQNIDNDSWNSPRFCIVQYV